MTEGRVRAIAAQVAAAIAAKIKPSVSEEQIRSDVEAVIRQMQENGELTGSDLTDEQIAAVQKNAEAAAGSATAAQTAQSKAEAAQTAAESAKSTAAQKATDATHAAQTATSKATEAAEANAAAQTAKGEAQTAATNAGKSATAASESAANAEASEEAAATSESNAAKSATAAAGSATTASNAATAAQTAQGKAEAAQAATEAAKAEFEQKLANGDYKGDPYTLTPADKAAIVQAVIESLGGQPVAGYFDEDNNIVLTSALADGDYTIKYEMGDNTYTLGTVTVKTTPNKYTVTFVADGVTVATVEYEEGATSITEPAVPVKDGYTGEWESYTLNNTNITVNAVYTENAPAVTTHGVTLNGTNCTSDGASSVNEGAAYTAKLTPSNGKNMIYTASVKMGGDDITDSAYNSATNTVNIAKVTGKVEITARAIKNLLPLAVDVNGNDYVGSHANGGDGWECGIRVNSTGAEVALAGMYCTGFMPCALSSKIRIKNVLEYTADNSRNRIQFYNSSKSNTNGTTLLQANTSMTYKDGVYTITPSAFVSTANFFRFACGSITADTIVTVDEEL